ncbi:preprotein translocase subunit SecG [Actinomadura rupiterrae]|nr:preprotein translocase subunit SecG [Actinomadura rupiterrae]
MSGEKSTLSGPKGFALVLAGMLAIIGVLFLIAYLAAP